MHQLSEYYDTGADVRQEIITFLSKCSVEVTPGGAAKIPDFREVLDPGTSVFVTFLPGSDFNATLATVKRLKEEGMYPIPHIAARSIPSRLVLEQGLKQLQEYGVKEALVIGGGVTQPVGEFTSSLEVLKTGLLQEYGIERVGVAGHPEGTPDIVDREVKEALNEKNAFSRETGIGMYIITQFCFEAAPVIEWERRILEEGNHLPIRIGLPGLATLKSLMQHARQCGIGPSMHVLTRQAANITKLMSTRTPDKIVRHLAEHRIMEPECTITGCHLYPLGGLKKSAAWLKAVQNGDFELNNEGGFDVTVDIS